MLDRLLNRVARRVLTRNASLRRALRSASRRQVAILMYHGVTDQPLPVYNWCHMPLCEFSEQMAFLAETYHPLPLSEVAGRMADGRPLPDLTVCVTFDDGFRNNLTNALPVLRKHGIPCTVFVSTALPDSGQPPWPERVFSAVIHASQSSLEFRNGTLPLASPAERLSAYHAVMSTLKQLPPVDREAEQDTLFRLLSAGAPDPALATLTWTEISELARNDLVRIGSHGHTHEILTLCTPDRQREELARSRDILLQKLGYCEMLAYPNGDNSQSLRQMSRDLGYRAAVTTRQRLVSAGADLFALDRIGVGSGWPLQRFETAILGY